jgi:hypothetical protein
MTDPDPMRTALAALIGEITTQVSNLRRMIDETADPRIAADLCADADRLGLLADAGARAIMAAPRPRTLPVLNESARVQP